MSVGVVGAGAFGTALALALSRQGPVLLWGRDGGLMQQMQTTRQTNGRLPGHPLPNALTATAELADLAKVDALLLCLPMQSQRVFLDQHPDLPGPKVLCCKGLDLDTGHGPTALVKNKPAAILSGPSFAADIAKGLPTALTLAAEDPHLGTRLQQHLSTPALRLYRTTDVLGVELGGALKNVIAIACGAVMGAGLGVSARAALMTRGFAEMQRLAIRLGAEPETLQGLSGFGDLALTCTSDLSRNYRYGFALGSNTDFDPDVTVEGRATAEAILRNHSRVDLPICSAVANLSAGRIDMRMAIEALMQRPLKEE